MKPGRNPMAGGLLFALLVVAWSPIPLAAAQTVDAPSAAEYQLLTNPGLEVYGTPYGEFHGVACQVATGWRRFPEVSPEPCWMDTRVFAYSDLGGDWVEKIEGQTSQMIVSTQPYTAGIWQQVSGLTPGVPYGFHAAMLTIYQSSAPPAVDGKMIKQVGIDPTGGTDPGAGTIVWSEPDDHDEGPWDVERRTAAYAQASKATVFVRVISPDGAGPWPHLNQSFFDSAILARTATVSAVSPAESQATTFLVSWGPAESAGGGTVRWYDAEWMDEAGGGWQPWFSRTTQTQANFSGERGHTYHFRARVWQRYPNGAHLVSPYRPQGDTQTHVQGPEVVGRVLSHEGHPVAGATVSSSGTTETAVSDALGRYRLILPPSSEPRTIAVSHPWWLAPAPVYDVTIGPAETVPIIWTLRPPDDAVANGGFEQELDGWMPIAEHGIAPQVVTAPVHTGHQALVLGGAVGAEYTVGVRQTAVLTHAWEPAVVFWYRPAAANPDGLFTVILTVVGQTAGGSSPGAVSQTVVFAPDMQIADWQHLPLYPLPEGYFTGSVTVQFQVEDDGDGTPTTVYLDEVSLGRTPGGPHRSYVPAVWRGF